MNYHCQSNELETHYLNNDTNDISNWYKYISNNYNFDYKLFVLYFVSEYEAEMAVPGFSKNDLKIQTKGNELIIKSNFNEEKNPSHFKKVFSKHYNISKKLDIKNIKVKLNDGLLHLTFKPSEKIQNISIEN
jgi:HSP20 family molecular chaperone IbpA